MKQGTRNLLSSPRRGWLLFGVVALALPTHFAFQVLELTHPDLAASLSVPIMACLLMVGGGWTVLRRLATQPPRLGQTTFERVQSLAQSQPPLPRLKPLDPLWAPLWLSRLTRPFPEPLAMLERIVFIAAALAIIALTRLPDDWIVRSIGADWLDPQVRALVAFSLIGLIAPLSIRLTAQAFDFWARAADTARPAASETSPATPPTAQRR